MEIDETPNSRKNDLKHQRTQQDKVDFVIQPKHLVVECTQVPAPFNRLENIETTAELTKRKSLYPGQFLKVTGKSEVIRRKSTLIAQKMEFTCGDQRIAHFHQER
ncbi:hypothetical protein CEXT_310421 [Caerostris extrusa]|uniref:Uncharacterized protein n=1 Tax=Caerostris extrusa TaxID=172846 RepID=A0AAV4UZH8_CAEEX|nr:hypothetical protein CEXT_310421 [Caerostris extrusa]